MLNYLLFVALTFLPGNAETPNTQLCCQRAKSKMYLEEAVNMIMKSMDYIPSDEVLRYSDKPMDCESILQNGINKSGKYFIWPRNRMMEEKPVEVFCDLKTDGGGWTVIQRRGNFSRAKEYFYKNWESYKKGFGDLEQEFWLGNDNIFALTNQGLYSIRFDLQAVNGEKRFAVYDSFWIDDEKNFYTLHIKDYTGDAGDSMIDTHDNQKFSTKDNDNDNGGGNCAEAYKGAWWYNNCHVSNLNGQNLLGVHESYADSIIWKEWRGYKESLLATEMKIRRKKFQTPTDLGETPTAT